MCVSEYDGYDDVYGHSVEDDSYCVSPSTAAQFLYDRTQQPSLSSYMRSQENEEIPEEDEELEHEVDEAGVSSLHDSFHFHQLGLSPADEVRLKGCLDEMRNILGESVPESVMVTAILRANFDSNAAADDVLGQQTQEQPKPQREPRDSRRNKGARQELQKPSAPLSVTLPTKPPEVTTGLTPSVARMTFTGIGAQLELEGATEGTRPKTQRVENLTRESGDKAVPIKKSWSSSNLEAGKGDLGDTPGRSATKSKAGKLDLMKEYEKRKASNDKENLNMVVIGHVDAGKSTLMGHVLYQLGFVNKKTMHKYEQESRKLGKASFAYAWVLDETDEERSRGVTMDVAQTRFETKSRVITLLDAPGHKDFIPNMITGAAQADVAILVVNATRGEFETGFESGGQTREHAMLIRSLGVSQLVVAINKMDTVGWLKDRYEEIVKKLAQFLKQAGFKENDIAYIPCSGLAGENLTSAPTVAALATWYTGPTLVEQIDNFKLPERQVSKPLRMCVSDVFKGMGSGFSVAGVIHAGAVQPGDRLLVMPQGELLTVKGVLIDDLPMQCAFAGDNVVLTVTGIDMSNVTVGSILCLPNDPIKAVTRFTARIVLLNIDVPITKGFPVVFHYLSTSEPAHIHKLVSLLHKSTGEVTKKKPRCLVKNSSAVIELQLDRPVCIELYKDYKALGRFMLRYAGSTIAAGLITEVSAISL
ncbi:hypothetical protein NP493_407g03006 [Ridgeia piscesae]|uniref:Tr-type G domain-containing protein n=1 Tax=Ridgeia piscesae TaxID=27915 RepID=A0AAD9L259_RIDPI|nr:hypothetical protein NP493_407g03006 [Ridgeia piscesae]